MGIHAAIRFFQCLRGLKHKDALGLVIVGGGGAAPSLQNGAKCLRLHWTVAKLAQGVPLRGQYGKIHNIMAPLLL